MCETIGEGNICESLAFHKGVVTDKAECRGKSEVGKCMTVAKSALLDGVYAVGDINGTKRCAAIEGFILNLAKVFGEFHSRETFATAESAFVYDGDSCWYVDADKVLTA